MKFLKYNIQYFQIKQKEKTQAKVNEFYDKLPDVKPDITTWRKSSGQLTKWRPSITKLGKSQSGRDMTWSQYHTNPGSLNHEVQNKIYMSSQEKLSGDPNSIEQLSKCRYLRQFKMRKNMPVK